MATEPQVTTVPTPNPNALMFRVQEALVPTGTYEYTGDDDTSKAPLAAKLLALDGVDLILIAPRFVTVNKNPDADWPDLVAPIKDTVRAFLTSGEMAVLDAGVQQRRGGDNELEKKIIEILDEEVRPAIAQDGGDVAFEGLVDGIVHLRLFGACGTCPSSTVTLKNGIEAMLMEEFPEVRGVEQAV